MHAGEPTRSLNAENTGAAAKAPFLAFTLHYKCSNSFDELLAVLVSHECAPVMSHNMQFRQ
jgi:hypothetical protein